MNSLSEPIPSPSSPSASNPERPSGSFATGVSAAGLALILLLVPGALWAQVCLGSPNAPGQFSLTGDANITESTNDFGVGVEANVPGPLGLRAGVSLEEDASDDRVARFEGRVSYDVRSNGLSICPVTGADYTSRTVNDESLTRIRVPLGLSVGGRLALSDGGPALIPSARAGLAHRRLSQGGLTETDNSLFVIGGGTVSVDEFFVRGEAGLDSADDVDPFFSVSLGVRF